MSDGSTDRTTEIIRAVAPPAVEVVELDARRGKAAALNAGLERARHEILVFSDASIDLEPDALLKIVRRFQDPGIGCVSGEDRIAESGGEAWYGRYELLVRRLESRVHSIVGASGSFYAQRRALCGPFAEGMAPDFLSVIRTAQQGYRAVAEPEAVGMMTSAIRHGQEFERKVRTFIRGITALFAHASVLNPFRHRRLRVRGVLAQTDALDGAVPPGGDAGSVVWRSRIGRSTRRHSSRSWRSTSERWLPSDSGGVSIAPVWGRCRSTSRR